MFKYIIDKYTNIPLTTLSNVVCCEGTETGWPLLSSLQEVAAGERIAYWIRTPQVPGSRPGWYGTFYSASDC